MSLLLQNPVIPLEVVPSAERPSAVLNSFCVVKGEGLLFPVQFFCSL